MYGLSEVALARGVLARGCDHYGGKDESERAARTYIVHILHLGELTRIGPNPVLISSKSHLAVVHVKGACMGVKSSP